VLHLTRILTGNEVSAVRAAAAISSCARELGVLNHGGLKDLIEAQGVDVDTDLLDQVPEIEIQIMIRHGADGQQLSYRWPVADRTPVVQRLSAFFDIEPDGPDSILASQPIPEVLAEEDSRIEGARQIIARKDRDELMADLRVRNLELQESLENLRRTRSAKERMESELNIGREIQMSMLPLDFPIYPDRHEFEAYAVLEPAREVGGDFYDLFLIDDRHFCFCVGDVAGKGVPSALFMAVTKTLIKSRAANDLSPASILSHVNSELCQNNESCMFVTVFLAILDLETGEMLFANAGHNPPYVRRSDGSLERLSKRHGPIVGAAEGIAYTQGEIELEPDDLVLLYTDGVTEAADDDYALYSEDRLADVLARLDGSELKAAIDDVVADIKLFVQGAEQSDDITILGVRFDGRSSSELERVLEITIANRLEEMIRVSTAFEELADRFGLDSKLRRKVNLAFDELLNNIISYGYDDDEEHQIGVRVAILPDKLTIKISDDGRPFNPFEMAEPDTSLSVEEREIGGLGVHLVKNLMDEVLYERRGERNVVNLVMNLE
jgi:sigma-B regulation protein RsbU (phosphoserine phosphatase)